MHKTPIEYLKHILDECEYIRFGITPGLEKNHFLENETLKRTVVRSLEVIGEATKKISADLNYNWKSISWKSMAGM
jgi:uncharacterized protein with HEPN domain